MPQAPTRRNVLRLMAGVPLFAAGATPAAAKAAPIVRLIEQSRALPQVARRIDFISQALLGVRYQAHTLIGGPNYPERFVVREDAFDCVTFCEVVLAAAIAANVNEFETALRRIRYDHGNVQWRQRNHYFADWSQRNIANGTCEAVKIEPSRVIDKTVTWHRELGRHPVSILAVPKAAMLEQANLLSPGDIIGFTSRRSDLDYFHTGLVAFDRDRTLLLRHASQSRGRVIEDKMATFVTVNPVKDVTLLRATERPPAAASH
jgi:hypothetical protein